MCWGWKINGRQSLISSASAFDAMFGFLMYHVLRKAQRRYSGALLVMNRCRGLRKAEGALVKTAEQTPAIMCLKPSVIQEWSSLKKNKMHRTLVAYWVVAKSLEWLTKKGERHGEETTVGFDDVVAAVVYCCTEADL